MDELTLYITKNAGIRDFKTSTRKMSNDLDMSQQTISRRLREMEKEGIIHRISTPNGVTVRLTTEAFLMLKKEYVLLRGLFEETSQLTGTVITGVNEGSYYVQEYKKKFEENLSFKPYLGTLNIITDQAQKNAFLADMNVIEVPEFKTKTRSFGAVLCYKVLINKTLKGAIIVPIRGRHPENIIELIAPVNIRKKFNVKDKDKLIIDKRDD